MVSKLTNHGREWECVIPNQLWVADKIRITLVHMFAFWLVSGMQMFCVVCEIWTRGLWRKPAPTTRSTKQRPIPIRANWSVMTRKEQKRKSFRTSLVQAEPVKKPLLNNRISKCILWPPYRARYQGADSVCIWELRHWLLTMYHRLFRTFDHMSSNPTSQKLQPLPRRCMGEKACQKRWKAHFLQSVYAPRALASILQNE